MLQSIHDSFVTAMIVGAHPALEPRGKKRRQLALAYRLLELSLKMNGIAPLPPPILEGIARGESALPPEALPLVIKTTIAMS